VSDIKQAFGTSTAMTITLTSLADAAARESTIVDNGTNKYLDALVQVVCELATGSPANEKCIYIWAYGSEDGTDYTDNATGSDAAVTLRIPHNFKMLGVINTPDSGGLAYKSHPMSVAGAFGGVMPRKWGIVVENQSGLAFESSGHEAHYTGIYTTVL
jgi:hypothetical protein